jgi:hypothetical protein
MSLRDQLNSYIQQVEKRLRLGAIVRGAAILTSVALAATVVLVLITNALAFSHWSITSARVALLFALVLAVTFGIALPVMALNRRRAAREAELAFPEFKERLVTFAERDAEKREPFLDLLALDTLSVARSAQPKSLVPDKKLATFLGVGAVSLCVLLWLILAGPGYFGEGAALLWAATPHGGSAAFYDIQVVPGDITVRRNSDLMVTAVLVGLDTRNVRLYARYQSASKWDEVAMHPQAGGSGFQFAFAGLPESVEYYVEAGPLDSKHYNIRVLDLPSVKNVRVTYRYPSWTHLQNVTEERGGDLRAVEGTDADLEIETDKPMRDGVLVLDDEQQLRLAEGGGNVYKGTIRMQKDGVYHVAVLDQGQPVRLSNDFFIEARKAEPPNVLVARPGHDYRASPIEEVTVAVKADDEFGLADMTLHYSVNGGPEKTVDLLKQKGAKQADGSTVLSLEDFKAVPGDVVSIYAVAKDAHSESRTDISFIQADPFEREFSQSQAAGGGGGGGGMGMGDQNDISQREKEIIAETWKHQGDKKATKQEAADASKFLSGVQAKLGDQARSLASRMQSRELSQENEEFGSFVKDMNAAAAAMGPAAQSLQGQKWQDAMPNEQKALQYLLRAEATFRKIEVAFGSAGGGGGAGGGAGRDLASLFDLELDTEKNQYETAQTAGSASQQQKAIDEALQKLDQLARRQEELAQQHNPQQSSEQRWQQEMLRRQAEELQHQMEQMARNGQNGSSSQSGSQQSNAQGSSSASGSSGQSGSGQSGANGAAGDPRVQQSLDRLRQATDDMRRATSPEQSEAAARRAADRLKEATDLLGSIRQQQSQSKVDSLADEAGRLAQEEKDQNSRIQQAFGGGMSVGNTPMHRKLADDREKLANELGGLEKNMQDTARELATNHDNAASTKMREALGDMQQSDLRARIQRGADWMRRGIDPNANGMEPEIAAGMDRLAKGLRDAQQAMGSAPGEGGDSQQQGIETALNRVERLRSELGGLSRDGQGGQPGQGQGQGQQGGQGQNGSNRYGRGGNQGAWSPNGGPGARIGGGADSGPYTNTYNGGGANGTIYGNLDTGNNTPHGGTAAPANSPPVFDQHSYDDTLRSLNQLRQSVRDDPESAKEVQQLIQEMERLDPSRFPGNPALVEQLHSQVLADVDKLELQLRRQLDDNATGQIRSGDTKSVPQGYEESVAEYYRRLSKNSK